MDSSPPELEDSIYPVNNGEMLPELENTMDNSLLELETVDFVNLCDESSNLSKEINISTFIHDDSEVICTSETADSFVLYKAMPKTQDPLACSEPKKNWDKLVHDITNKLNICDQTAPEYMHQTALESTMIPKSRKINSDAFNLTGYKQMKMGDDSLTVFEDIEREVQSPLKVSPQKKCAAQINCDNVSETSGITSVYETAQQSSASSLGSQSLKDVFESAHNSTGSSCDMSDMTDDHVLRSPLSNDFSADTSYSISPCVKDVLYKSKSCTKSTVKDDDSVKIIDQSDNSLEFDNTFDEMQYLMNANNKLKQKALDTPLKDNFSNGTITPERQAAPYPKFSPITPTSETSTPIGPPTTLLSAGRPKRTYYPARHAESDNQFRVPTLPSRKIHSPHNNQYSHIVSPIALYIKNSPKVPLVGKHVPNITGSKDLKSPSQKHVFRNKLVDEKENDGVIIGTPVLPTKAYKTSAYTALVSFNFISYDYNYIK